jgi:uncharacterized repeat protein (TIGR03803 family)
MKSCNRGGLIILLALIVLSAGGASAQTLTTLYSFPGNGGDGSNSTAPLILDASGALYGTTAGGGSGNGTVFKLTPPSSGAANWSEALLYSFGGPDGASPAAGVISDGTGALYGTTVGGGGAKGSLGTVFMLTPPAVAEGMWTETLLHSFTGDGDGAYPAAGLVSDLSGALYGTTSSGELTAAAPFFS